MVVSGMLRAIALLCLSAAFQGPFLKPGQCGSFRETSDVQSSVRQSYTVKDISDFLGKLNESGIKARVLWKVEEMVRGYLNLDGIPGESIEKNINAVLERILELRKRLLNEPDNYGKYTDYSLSEGFIDSSSAGLVQWLPMLHSELWHLYYQISKDCILMGGAEWMGQKPEVTDNKKELHNWFTDKLEMSVPSMLKGFRDGDLSDNRLIPHDAPRTGISLHGGAPLNYVQYGLFFLSPTWHHSNLGSAVLFLQEFCGEVEGNKFDSYFLGKNYDSLKSSCGTLFVSIKSLTNILRPLYAGSTALYNGKLRPESMSLYLEWLEKNLHGMKKSFDQMLSETANWTKDMLTKAESSGPFKYGFVFKDSKWEEPIKSKLPDAIRKLTASDAGSFVQLCEEIKMFGP